MKLLAFLFGAFLFGVSFVIGLLAEPKNFGLYYMFSIISGLFWIWAVFQDIRDMKGKSNLLKEELQLMIRSGQGTKTSKLEGLLNNLEELSPGNLAVYKLRIREILNMITDTTIEAGGDTQSLIVRNTERGNAIESSSDVKEIRDIISREAIELSEILSGIPDQNASNLIGAAINHLEEKFAEDLSVDEIAESVGVSKAHLMREFKKRTGQTLNQYQTYLRIEQAKKELANKSVTETAYLVGYNNPNYFSTVFKKQTGYSPIAYQQTLNISQIENK